MTYAVKFYAVGCPVYLCSGSDIFLPARLIGGLPLRFLQNVTLWVGRTSFNISPSWQTGVIVLLPRSVVRSSTVEPLIVARSGYRGPQCVCGS